jgi:hypothetical protein
LIESPATSSLGDSLYFRPPICTPRSRVRLVSPVSPCETRTRDRARPSGYGTRPRGLHSPEWAGFGLPSRRGMRSFEWATPTRRARDRLVAPCCVRCGEMRYSANGDAELSRVWRRAWTNPYPPPHRAAGLPSSALGLVERPRLILGEHGTSSSGTSDSIGGSIASVSRSFPGGYTAIRLASASTVAMMADWMAASSRPVPK